MTVNYLVKSEKHLVKLLASNLFPKAYHFYHAFWIPPGKDPILTDAKLLVAYECYRSKEQAYRRRKAGLCTTRYFRVRSAGFGALAVLVSTEGKGPFFEREPFLDARVRRLHVAGYWLGVNRQTGKTSVRLHPEHQRTLRSELYAMAKEDARTCEAFIREKEILSFKGTLCNLHALVKDLNHCRKLFRKKPVDPAKCIRHYVEPEPLYLESPPEIEELMRWYAAQK